MGVTCTCSHVQLYTCSHTDQTKQNIVYHIDCVTIHDKLQVLTVYGLLHVCSSVVHCISFPVGFHDDYYRSHDHMGYIGADRNATIAAASMHVPQGMFLPPIPPPQHCFPVSLTLVTIN